MVEHLNKINFSIFILISVFTLSLAVGGLQTTYGQVDLTINKNTTGGDGVFNFTVAGPTPSGFGIQTIGGSGSFGLFNITAGFYNITEVALPPGFSLNNVTCTGTAGIIFFNPPSITINQTSAGENVECTFFNKNILTQIQGLKFEDSDANGIQNGNETGVGGIDILLFKLTPPDVNGTLIQNVTTGLNGIFNFINIEPGSYRVEENTPEGTIQTFPINGQPHFIEILVGSETITNINFGNDVTLASEIQGMKFNDTNRNGIKDLGEAGIPNVQISISPSFQTTLTDSNGDYSFTNLSAGTYFVWEQFLSNTIFTTPRTQTVVVGFNQTVVNVDFGDAPTLPLPPDMSIPSSGGTTSNNTPTQSRFTNLVIQKTITVCTPEDPPKVTLTFPDGTVKTSSMIIVSGIFQATFAPTHPPGTASMRVDIDCPPDTPNYPDDPANIGGEDAFQLGDIVFLDPSGRVLDVCTNDPIPGATVTLLKEFPPTSGSFIIPDTADHIPADNPQTTLADGSYGWDVTPGLYKLVANKTGFVTTESITLEIPPPVTDLDIVLQRAEGCPPVADANGPYLTAVDTPVNLNASASSDPDGVIVSYEWDLDNDGLFNNATGVAPSFTSSQTGIFDIAVKVTDDDGKFDTAGTFVVVFDPEGGFVTGGGTINSPAGAFIDDTSLTGKANFGFVSKYKKGATIPTGVTEFQFKVADLNFHSDSYEFLVVAGAKAMFKGVGTINGAGNFGFMLSAIDEKLTPSTDTDLFRIKIVDKATDTLVYDNKVGETDDNADPSTAISGGSIVIHKAK